MRRKSNIFQLKLLHGIRPIRSSSPLDFVGLIKFGFTLQTPPAHQSVNLGPMIAKAAYYRAEKLNFYPVHAMNDWIEETNCHQSLT
jgi:hypothetical protein